MTAPGLIVNALLDSSAEEFMQSFKTERPVRYEFERAPSPGTYSVKRWNWEGSYNYIGTVQFLHNLGTWWVREVAPRIFYTLKSKVGSHLLPRRAAYVASKGPFDTKEAAADKLWELYEQT